MNTKIHTKVTSPNSGQITITLEERINAFVKLGNALEVLLEHLETNKNQEGNELEKIIRRAHNENQWFTESQTLRALKAISTFLDRKSLEKWIQNYKAEIEGSPSSKRVGLIMAGNIPAVGFHDVLCVLLSGHTLMAKLSSDDKVLIPFLLEMLISIDSRVTSLIKIVDRIENPEAVIATGSNNSARYFEYYFGKYPHVIRKNRNSIAVMNGNETREELKALGDDIFAYFGLGCRNVSKIYVPQGYEFKSFFPSIECYSDLMNHNKYMNNYDYHHSIFLLNDEKFLTNNFLIVKENESLATPVSVLHYEFYSTAYELENKLKLISDKIQCRVGVGGIPFGTTQTPGLSDYADGVDTMRFLISLK